MAQLLLLNGMSREMDIMDGTGRRFSDAVEEGMRAQGAIPQVLGLASLPMPAWDGAAPAARQLLGTAFGELAAALATSEGIVVLLPACRGAVSGVVKNVFDLVATVGRPPAARNGVLLAAIVSEDGHVDALAAQACAMLGACACALPELAEAALVIDRARVRDSLAEGDHAVRLLQRAGILAGLLLAPARSEP